MMTIIDDRTLHMKPQKQTFSINDAKTKLGIFVGEEKWQFLNEVYADLAKNYQCEVFKQRTYNTPFFSGRLNRWANLSSMRRVLQDNDICFFEWSSELLMHASHMPKQCRIITRLHSFELYQWALEINWDAVDRVILVSKAMQEMFSDLYPAHAHKTTVIYNGRSLDAFKPPAKREFGFNLGMLCSIKPVKRIYEIVLMLNGLVREGYDARLYIAGEPEGDLRYPAAIYRLVERLNLQERVVFDGFVVDTPTWLQKIDIFISNSFWEGQQVALLEAMASGCYCLSHSWSGAEEMLPAENLFLTEAELKKKIVDFSNLTSSEMNSKCLQLREIACEKFNVERTKAGVKEVIDLELARQTNIAS